MSIFIFENSFNQVIRKSTHRKCNVNHIISSLPQNIRITWMIVHFCSQCKKFNNYKPCHSPDVFLYCLNDLNKTKTKIYNYDDTVFHVTLEIIVPCILLMIYRFNKYCTISHDQSNRDQTFQWGHISLSSYCSGKYFYLDIKKSAAWVKSSQIANRSNISSS